MRNGEDNGKRNARAHLERMMELCDDYKALLTGEESETIIDGEKVADPDEIIKRAMEIPLEIKVKSGWEYPGKLLRPEEFKIVISAGGPACRIRGIIGGSDHDIQYQDWFTPWKNLDNITSDEQDALDWFVELFALECY